MRRSVGVVHCVALAVVVFCCAPAQAAQQGDLNGDGFVGALDLQIVLTNWGQVVTPVGDLGQGDIFPDGFIGLADLSFLLVNWGQGTIPTPGGDASLGINLSEIAYFSREWVFVDAVRSARRWVSTNPGGQPFDSGQTVVTDADGWPILQSGEAAQTLLLTDKAGYPAGTYTVTFEGSGSLAFEFDASNVLDTGPGTMSFVVNVGTKNGILMRIDNSDPGDPVRNIRVWMPGHDANSPSSFHPLFIQKLQPFGVIRFMDWQQTNGSDLVSWSDRTTLDTFSQDTDDGVALEYMIELCNELGADAWFSMPHQADDNFVTQFATMVRDNLNPGLDVYIEWSNEVWNVSFPQHQWVTQTASGTSSVTQQIEFNNGTVSTGGLALSLSRDVATYNGQDSVVDVNAPRYGKTSAVHSRSEATARNEMAGHTTAAYRLLAGGVDNDGVSPLAFIIESGTFNRVWVRSGPDLNTQNLVVPASSPLDLLDHSIPDRSHTPQGAKIVHGLMFALCSVRRSDGPNTIETVTLCYSTNAGAGWSIVGVEPGSQWSVDARYPEPTAGAVPTSITRMGEEWALNWFPADDLDEPLDIWITFTDYRKDDKDGGSAYICRATRPAVGGAWVVQDVRRVYTHAAIGSTEHAHSCAMAKDPVTGFWHAVIFFGDSDYNHTVNVTLVGDATDYTNLLLSANETWSGGVAGSTTVARSAQPTACFPLANGDIAAVGDNERQTILAVKASSLGEPKAQWYGVGPQAGTRYSGGLALVGDFTRDRLGRCYVTRHNRKEGQSGPVGEESAIASIDGMNWFALGLKYMRFVAGPYMIGLDGKTLYTLPRPTASSVRTVHPLEVAPGGQNIAMASLMTMTPTTPMNGTVVRRVDPDENGDYLWPASGGFTKAGEAMPAPPRPGVITAFNTADATHFESWMAQIVASPPPDGDGADWMVVVWVLVPQDSAKLAFKLWQNDTQKTSTRVVGNVWTKLSMQRKWLAGNSGTLRMLLDSVTTTSQHPEFAVLLEGAYVGRVTPYHIPFSTTGQPNELAVVTGLSVGSDWSVGVDLHYPDYYDAAHGLGPLVTLYQDATNYITVETVTDPSEDQPCAAAGPVAGDLDGDRFVGLTDMTIVLSNWNQSVTPGDLLSGDPSGDGSVGIVDLNMILNNWNAGCLGSEPDDGFPYDFKITVTQGGVAGTPVYFHDLSYQMPGAPIRLIVSKVDADTVISLQHDGVFPAEAATITGESITPKQVKLGSNHDGTAVNALEFTRVAVAATADEVFVEATDADTVAAAGVDTGTFSPAWFQTWADEAANDFGIWHSVFSTPTDQTSRIIRVAAGQQANVWVTENLTDRLKDLQTGEFAYDAIACAAYFDHRHAPFDINTTEQDIIDNAINVTIPNDYTRYYQNHGDLAQQRTNELGRTIPFLAYEGGQHYTVAGNTSLPYFQAFLDVQTYDDPVLPDMYDAYTANLQAFDQAGGGLYMAYNYVGKAGPFGAWGHLQFQNEDQAVAPKYRALLDFGGN